MNKTMNNDDITESLDSKNNHQCLLVLDQHDSKEYNDEK